MWQLGVRARARACDETRQRVAARSVCDEGNERKHFHAACGRRLCGDVNEATAQMLLTLLFGAPSAAVAATRSAPLREFVMCNRCKAKFDFNYSVDLAGGACGARFV